MVHTRALSDQRGLAAGILNQLRGSGWIGLAEELADLNDLEFERLTQALKMYREAIKQENQASRP